MHERAKVKFFGISFYGIFFFLNLNIEFDWDSIDGNYSSEELIDLSQYFHCLMELRHARRMSSKKIDNFSVSQVESEFIQLLSQKRFEYSFRECKVAGRLRFKNYGINDRKIV
ncbi:hypothetical protein WICPIJ_006154 [Wickerhamomyces pijperi]|uniref:Uncharacterized protein n=1 Tax=Wickerhamomyces pijperi TaxID=599730 RepID=A0A9P8Q4B7_WICPI|nr:hypothetical protein WICPIJ_006154 [Wickerhamomyces pijperi]